MAVISLLWTGNHEVCPAFQKVLQEMRKKGGRCDQLGASKQQNVNQCLSTLFFILN